VLKNSLLQTGQKVRSRSVSNLRLSAHSSVVLTVQLAYHELSRNEFGCLLDSNLPFRTGQKVGPGRGSNPGLSAHPAVVLATKPACPG